jgi:hypothetical protein
VPGAINELTNNTYNVNDTAITEVASNDLLPIYDTSASGKKKIAVSNFIGGLVSNPNLLDNPWFTVNQRKKTTYSGAGYTVDRWKSYINDATISISNNGITITRGNSSTRLGLLQYFENLDYLRNKVVTASIMLSDGTIKKATFTIPDTADSTVDFIELDGFGTVVGNFRPSNPFIGIFSNVANASITIRAVKLELGSVSTLAMDTAPNYATELLKCQRYFERSIWYSWGCIQCTTAGMITYGMTYPFLEIKRAAPTFTFNVSGNTGIGNGVIRDLTAGTTIPSSEVVLMQPDAFNNRIIQMKLQHSSFVVGHQYFVAVGDNCVDISADL